MIGSINSLSFLLMTMTVLWLTGCGNIGNLSKTGIATTLTTTGATAALTGNPYAAGAIGVVGIGTDMLVNEDETTTSKLEALPVGERSAYLKSIAFWKALTDLGGIAIGAAFLAFLIPYLLGFLTPSRRKKKLEQLVLESAEHGLKR